MEKRISAEASRRRELTDSVYILEDRLEGSKVALAGWYNSQHGLDLEDSIEHGVRDEHWNNWTEEFEKLVRGGYETGRYGVELVLSEGLSRGRELREVDGKTLLFGRVIVEGPLEIALNYIEKHRIPQDSTGERPLAANFSDMWQFYTANREMKVAFSLLQIGRMLSTQRGDLRLTS